LIARSARRVIAGRPLDQGFGDEQALDLRGDAAVTLRWQARETG
jgi:hypothetical protein